MSDRMSAIVDVGAFKCPMWIADGLMVLMEIECLEQHPGHLDEKKVWEHADDWLIGNGFAPLEKLPRKRAKGGKYGLGS